MLPTVPAETGDFAGSATPHKTSWRPPTNYSSFVAGRVGWLDNVTVKQFVTQRNALWAEALNPRCEAAHPADDFVCFTIDTLYTYVQAPLFVVNNMYDSNQIHTQMGMPAPDPEQPLSGTTTAYFKYYGGTQRLSVQQVVANAQKKGDGLFLASCYDHTGNLRAK